MLSPCKTQGPSFFIPNKCLVSNIYYSVIVWGCVTNTDRAPIVCIQHIMHTASEAVPTACHDSLDVFNNGLLGSCLAVLVVCFALDVAVLSEQPFCSLHGRRTATLALVLSPQPCQLHPQPLLAPCPLSPIFVDVDTDNQVGNICLTYTLPVCGGSAYGLGWVLSIQFGCDQALPLFFAPPLCNISVIRAYMFIWTCQCCFLIPVCKPVLQQNYSSRTNIPQA
jgi:hypothetical protein